jgi:hypothetical protein
MERAPIDAVQTLDHRRRRVADDQVLGRLVAAISVSVVRSRHSTPWKNTRQERSCRRQRDDVVAAQRRCGYAAFRDTRTSSVRPHERQAPRTSSRPARTIRTSAAARTSCSRSPCSAARQVKQVPWGDAWWTAVATFCARGLMYSSDDAISLPPIDTGRPASAERPPRTPLCACSRCPRRPPTYA